MRIAFTSIFFTVMLSVMPQPTFALTSAKTPAPAFAGVVSCSDSRHDLHLCQDRFPAGVGLELRPGLHMTAHESYLDILYASDRIKSYTFGSEPFLCCDIQAWLPQLSPGVWGARFQIERLDEAVLTISLANIEDTSSRASALYVGPHAARRAVVKPDPRVPKAERISIVSGQLGATRNIEIFRGENCKTSLTNCRTYYVADGGNLRMMLSGFAENQLNLISNVVIVGISDAPDSNWGQVRMKELLKGYDPMIYSRFVRFVISEVIPRVEGDTALGRPEHRYVVGMSNGAAWALDMAESYPEVFHGALAFSVANTKNVSLTQNKGVFFIGAGTLEGDFLIHTRAVASAVSSSGAQVYEHYVVGGHSLSTWSALFQWALKNPAYKDN